MSQIGNTVSEKLITPKMQRKQPQVWDCHAGKKYPADAVYVGCRTVHPFKGYVIREGTIFGNGANPLISHEGALHSESEFRAYAIERLKDPAFRAEAEKLRGKDLLCWCVQKGKRRADFCHARVWLDLINGPEQFSLNLEAHTDQRRDFDWGYYQPNFITRTEADALFEMAKAQPRVRPIIKRSGHPQVMQQHSTDSPCQFLLILCSHDGFPTWFAQRAIGRLVLLECAG